MHKAMTETSSVGLPTVSGSESQSDKGQSPSYAWAYWENWSGRPDLIAQAARSSVWAVIDAGVSNTPECRIDVFVAGDTESFSSPVEFRHEATAAVLRKCSGIRVSVGAAKLFNVTVRFCRRKDGNNPWPPVGVLLEVKAPHSSSKAVVAVPNVRDRICRAIERGRVRQTPEAHRGESQGGQPLETIQERQSERRWRFSLRRTLIVGLASFFVFGLTPFGDAFFSLVRRENPVSPTAFLRTGALSDPLSVGMTAVFALAAVAYMEFLGRVAKRPTPAVAIAGVRETPTWMRIPLRGIATIVGGVLVALLAAYLGSLVGLKPPDSK